MSTHSLRSFRIVQTQQNSEILFRQVEIHPLTGGVNLLFFFFLRFSNDRSDLEVLRRDGTPMLQRLHVRIVKLKPHPFEFSSDDVR